MCHGLPLNHPKTATVDFSTFFNLPSVEEADWSLLRPGRCQLLPCPVPFEDCGVDVTPAIQGYVMGQFADARRFMELRRLSSSHDDPQQWAIRLVECMLELEQGNADAAWQSLQLGLTWQASQDGLKNATASKASTAVRPAVRDYLIMATIALSGERIEAAETYASRAISIIESEPHCGVGDVLRDTRADAMLVFAAIRLQQQRCGEAETLLQYAYDAHMQAGDLEQVIVGLVLQADIESSSLRRTAATTFLMEARRLTREKCDPGRHLRHAHLCQVVDDRLRTAHRSAGHAGGNASLN